MVPNSSTTVGNNRNNKKQIYPYPHFHRYLHSAFFISLAVIILLFVSSSSTSSFVYAAEDEISIPSTVDNNNVIVIEQAENPLSESESPARNFGRTEETGCTFVVDSTSSLHCPYLDDNDFLVYGQSINCVVNCMYGNSITTGYVSDFQFCIGYLDPIQQTSGTLLSSNYNDSSLNTTILCPNDDSSELSLYGEITNLTGYDTTVISFTYVAPTVDQNIILRVKTSGQEIRHSPLLIAVKSPAEASSSTPFFSFHNTSFIIVFAVVCTVVVAVMVSCLYSYCEMQKARAEATTKNAREQFWINAVVNDCPQSNPLSHSLLR